MGAIADDEDIVVIGSQAILGEFPEAPEELRLSREADVYPRTYPERADLIDGSIGEGSPFERLFGYYAHGVGPETAVLPEGWEGRLPNATYFSTFGDVSRRRFKAPNKGVVMGLRPTKTNEGANDRCRGINNLDRAFNRAVGEARRWRKYLPKRSEDCQWNH